MAFSFQWNDQTNFSLKNSHVQRQCIEIALSTTKILKGLTELLTTPSPPHLKRQSNLKIIVFNFASWLLNTLQIFKKKTWTWANRVIREMEMTIKTNLTGEKIDLWNEINWAMRSIFFVTKVSQKLVLWRVIIQWKFDTAWHLIQCSNLFIFQFSPPW